VAQAERLAQEQARAAEITAQLDAAVTAAARSAARPDHVPAPAPPQAAPSRHSAEADRPVAPEDDRRGLAPEAILGIVLLVAGLTVAILILTGIISLGITH
jgi:hypothetical protein